MWDKLFDIFNNREIAIFIVALVLIPLLLRGKDVRKSILGVFEAFFRLNKPFILLIAYITIEVYLLQKYRIWETFLLKDTFYWTFGAIIMMVNLNDVTREHYFRDTLLDNIKFVAVITFVSNLTTFNLLVELILLPIIILLSIILACTDKPYLENIDVRITKKLNNLTTFLLSGYGIITLFNSMRYGINHFDEFYSLDTLKSYLLPFALTLFFLPFMYFLGIYSNYETLFTRMNVMLRYKPKLLRYAKFRIILYCTLSLKRVKVISTELKIALINDEKELKTAIRDISRAGKQKIQYLDNIPY